MRRRVHLPSPGDPFLVQIGHETYLSAAQASATRAVMSAPAGSTLAVVLPTGEGKSLSFHAIAKQGYPDSAVGRGTTLVITPTVSLALDHERSARYYGYREGPLAYRSGNVANNDLIRKRVQSGDQEILFAAPEAVTGPLLGALLASASSGALRALVIDEAHLVDTWGDVFRPDFQLMSGVRRQLLTVAPDPKPRTVLLTATLTEACAEVLRRLFLDRPGDDLPVSAATSLRPEVDYWTTGVVDAVRQQRYVEEAILNLPRPLILYTTERRAAERWYRRLKDLGFSRLGMMTGDTGSSDRELLVDRWRNQELDLVVGTSAFGLGIDNPNVRAVVHACLPEGLDRFYQEVGRSGRDGAPAISLLIPTARDVGIGESLAKKRLISVERGFERWESMASTTRPVDDSDLVAVRVDVPPSLRPGDIDMKNDQNRDWNVRTLTLMSLAGLISMAGAPARTGPAAGSAALGEAILIRVPDPGRVKQAPWSHAVGEYRTSRLGRPAPHRSACSMMCSTHGHALVWRWPTSIGSAVEVLLRRKRWLSKSSATDARRAVRPAVLVSRHGHRRPLRIRGLPQCPTRA